MNDHESFQGEFFWALRAAITPRVHLTHRHVHTTFISALSPLYQTLPDCSRQARRFSVLERTIDFSQLAATCLLARAACVLLHVFGHRDLIRLSQPPLSRAYFLRPFAPFRAPWTSFVFRIHLSLACVPLASFCTFSSTMDLTRRSPRPHVSVTLSPPLLVPSWIAPRRSDGFQCLSEPLSFLSLQPP